MNANLVRRKNHRKAFTAIKKAAQPEKKKEKQMYPFIQEYP